MNESESHEKTRIKLEGITKKILDLLVDECSPIEGLTVVIGLSASLSRSIGVSDEKIIEAFQAALSNIVVIKKEGNKE